MGKENPDRINHYKIKIGIKDIKREIKITTLKIRRDGVKEITQIHTRINSLRAKGHIKDVSNSLAAGALKEKNAPFHILMKFALTTPGADASSEIIVGENTRIPKGNLFNLPFDRSRERAESTTRVHLRLRPTSSGIS